MACYLIMIQLTPAREKDSLSFPQFRRFSQHVYPFFVIPGALRSLSQVCLTVPPIPYSAGVPMVVDGMVQEPVELCCPAHLSFQIHHLYGCYGGFTALVPQFAAGSFFCLHKIMGCEDTENERDTMFHVELGDAQGDALADIGEMRGLPLDDATEADNGLDLSVQGHQVCPQCEFKATRYVLQGYIFPPGPMFQQCVNGGIAQGLCNFAVPPGYDNSDTHILCGRQGTLPLQGILLVAGGHVDQQLIHPEPRTGDIFLNIASFGRLREVFLNPCIQFECLFIFTKLLVDLTGF